MKFTNTIIILTFGLLGLGQSASVQERLEGTLEVAVHKLSCNIFSSVIQYINLSATYNEENYNETEIISSITQALQGTARKLVDAVEETLISFKEDPENSPILDNIDSFMVLKMLNSIGNKNRDQCKNGYIVREPTNSYKPWIPKGLSTIEEGTNEFEDFFKTILGRVTREMLPSYYREPCSPGM